MLQIPSVGKSLLQAMMNPSDPIGRLFAEFRMIPFTQNIRAAEDPKHMDIQQFFREPRLGLRPVQSSQLLDHLKVLSVEDVTQDKGWLDAPVVVTDNNKRRAMNREQARRHSLRVKHALVMWRNTLDTKTTAAFQSCAARHNVPVSTVLDQHEELWSYFVPGAPGELQSLARTQQWFIRIVVLQVFPIDQSSCRIVLCTPFIDLEPFLWTRRDMGANPQHSIWRMHHPRSATTLRQRHACSGR